LWRHSEGPPRKKRSRVELKNLSPSIFLVKIGGLSNWSHRLRVETREMTFRFLETLKSSLFKYSYFNYQSPHSIHLYRDRDFSRKYPCHLLRIRVYLLCHDPSFLYQSHLRLTKILHPRRQRTVSENLRHRLSRHFLIPGTQKEFYRSEGFLKPNFDGYCYSAKECLTCLKLLNLFLDLQSLQRNDLKQAV